VEVRTITLSRSKTKLSNREMPFEMNLHVNLESALLDTNAPTYRSYYDRWANRYASISDEGKMIFHEKIQMPVLQAEIETLQFKNTLDVGCGIGGYSDLLSKHSERVLGIDISPNMIELAKKRSTLDNVEFQASDILEFETNEKFDFILAGFMLSYFSELSELFSKICSLMQNDAKLIITCLHPIRMSSVRKRKEGYQVENYLSEGFYISDFIDEADKLWLNRHTFSDIINAGLNSGLKLEKVVEPKIQLSEDDRASTGECFYDDNPSILLLTFRK
jgi:2-polyprenyl-3-methyl-5-hydroxy-6-metoxy-1,4-benzoquinol methylase